LLRGWGRGRSSSEISLVMVVIGVRKNGGGSGAFIGGRWARDCEIFGPGSGGEFWFWARRWFGALDLGVVDGEDTVSAEAHGSWGRDPWGGGSAF
jgi:hypothetical protein